MPKIIRLYKSNSKLAVDIEQVLDFLKANILNYVDSQRKMHFLKEVKIPLFWLEKINQHLSRYPHLIVNSNIESILVFFKQEGEPALDVHSVLRGILEQAKKALAIHNGTITSTGVILEHLNFSGIKDWAGAPSCAGVNADEETFELSSSEEDRSDDLETNRSPQIEKKENGFYRRFKSRWKQLELQIHREEQFVKQKKAEISRYFDLPAEKQEVYKTQSYHRQKKIVGDIELKLKPVQDEMAQIIHVHDATLNKVYRFIVPILFSASSDVDELLSPDALTQFVFNQSRVMAEAHLEKISQEEQEPYFAYFDEYKRNIVLGGLFLILANREAAQHYFQKAIKCSTANAEAPHLSVCRKLLAALEQAKEEKHSCFASVRA